MKRASGSVVLCFCLADKNRGVDNAGRFMKMRSTQLRAIAGVVFAIIVLAVFAVIAGKVMGFEVPVLSGLAEKIGF